MSDRLYETQDLPDDPIEERVKTIVPDVTVLAETLKIEHVTAARLHKLLIVQYAQLVTMAEEINQLASGIDRALLAARSTIEAQATLVSDQRRNMEVMEDTSDKNAGARTVLKNLSVWVTSHEPTIRYGLECARLDKVTEAARKMKKSRVLALVDALLRGAELR